MKPLTLNRAQRRQLNKRGITSLMPQPGSQAEWDIAHAYVLEEMAKAKASKRGVKVSEQELLNRLKAATINTSQG